MIADVAGEDTGGDNPFANLKLDEEFVRTATISEPSADVRAARARRAQALVNEQEWHRQRQQSIGGPGRRAVRQLRNWRRWAPAAVLVFALALLGRAGGVGRSGPEVAVWLSGPRVVFVVDDSHRPTPRRAESAQPLGVPMTAPAQPGPYRFLRTQTGSDEPVAYDPCRPISVVVNPRTAPVGGERLVAEALAEVTRVTGLQFVMEGTTNELPRVSRQPFQPDRYGDRWAPVLVAWSDEAEVATLRGRVIGAAGSGHDSRGLGSPDVYVSGSVTLDGPDFKEVLGRDGGWELARSVVLHELGHLVGLDHVADPSQVMYDEASADVVAFEAGDLAGLVQLGQGPCVAEL